MIEVKHLTKNYGPNRAVDDLSFTVEKGQIYGFLGPNGAGKSTTMNIMTGYIAPSAGQVLVDGHDIMEDSEAARRCIGYLPEIPPVYPDMSVREYLDFAAGLKRLQKETKEQMIAEAMNLTGTMEVQNRLIRNLSKGFRQRVGLAQAILGYPDILILDEPMVGLDPKQIIEIRELIRELSQKHTIILSSHILSEISAICDHIMIIAHGRLVASDTPENLTGLMAGAAALELTVRGEKERIQTVLSGLDGIRELSFGEPREEGTQLVTVHTQEKQDLREELFYACAEAKLPILGMTKTHASLEDVFLELTEGTQAAEEDAPKKRRSPFRKKNQTAQEEGQDNESDL